MIENCNINFTIDRLFSEQSLGLKIPNNRLISQIFKYNNLNIYDINRSVSKMHG